MTDSRSVGKWTYGANTIRVLQWNPEAKLIIGSFCSISSNVTCLLGCNHNSAKISTYPFPPEHFTNARLNTHNLSKGGIKIGNDVWIGHGVTILDGVTIGDGAIIGANSLVTKNVLDYSIVGGNPAKIIRQRFDKDTEKIIKNIRWWELEDETINRLLPLIQSACNLTEAKELYLKTLIERKNIAIFI